MKMQRDELCGLWVSSERPRLSSVVLHRPRGENMYIYLSRGASGEDREGRVSEGRTAVFMVYFLGD